MRLTPVTVERCWSNAGGLAAAANLPKTSAQIEFDDLVPGWPATEANRRLLAEVAAVSRALGLGTLSLLRSTSIS